MTLLIILFGALILVMGLVLMVDPTRLFGLIDQHKEKPGFQITAVVTRLVLGALLVSQASESRYPHVIEIIGWIAIFAAVVLAVIGRDRFKRLMSWVMNKVGPVGRIGGVAAALFGAVIIYAFV